MTVRDELRFGVLWNGRHVSHWQARCIDALAALPGVQAAALIVGAGAGPATRVPLLQRYLASYLVRRSRALRPDALEIATHGAVRVSWDDAADPDAALSAIARCELDFAISFDAGPVSPLLLEVLPHGVWSFRWQGGPAAPAVAPGFWEIVSRSDTTEIALHAQTAERAGSLGRAFSRTRHHSYVRTVDDALLGASALPARACRTLLAGLDAAAEAPNSTERAAPPAGGSSVPANRDVLRLLVTMASRFVRDQAKALLLAPQWNVGVVDAPIHRFVESSAIPEPRWLPRRGRKIFVADPFGLPDGSREWLAEFYDHSTRRGVIKAIDPRAPTVTTEPVIDIDGHASYPYLIDHDGEIYCLPQLESSEGIRVFRAVQYPTRWEQTAVLVPGVAARDATAFEHQRRWWLFFTDAAGPNTQLHVWWSDSFHGEWHPHPRNPVKIDVRSSRPAGTPFVRGETLFRPAQDCSRSYGGAVTICRVDVLTPTDFHETVVRVVRPLPGRYRHGMHTLSESGETTLIDGKRLVFSLAASRTALASRVRSRTAGSGQSAGAASADES